MISRRLTNAGMCALVVGATTALATPAASATPAAAGTAGLAPDLAAAYSSALLAATQQGVPLTITSGARSWPEQEQLWRDGLAQYGSPALARRWVLPPAESTHVSGRAVDVGPFSGAQWLSANGYRWGLCRTFLNEWWHFEIATAAGAACPAPVADASQR